MFLVGVAIVMVGAGVAWAASRGATPTGGSGGGVTPPPPQPPPAPPNFGQDTGSRSTPQTFAPPAAGGSKEEGKGLDGAALINLSGVLGGIVGGEASFTNVGKALAAPIGLGVATIAVLAGAASSLSVAALWLAPVFLITTSIIAIVDGIARTAQNEMWRKAVMEVAALRASGRHREALHVYEQAAGVMMITEDGVLVRQGGEVSKISQLWPQPGEDWFNVNASADFGRPYPGFPGPPAPASLVEIAAHRDLLPESITTTDGQSFDTRKLIAQSQAHVAAYRDWALANGVVGELPAWGPQEIGKSATSPTRPLATATTGPRDVSKWPELIEAKRQSKVVIASMLSAFPWLAAIPVPPLPANPLDLSAQVAAFRGAAATTEAARRTVISEARRFGSEVAGTGLAARAQRTALAAALKAETVAEVAATRTGAGTVTDTAGGTSTGTRVATNTASDDGHAGGNPGRWTN